MKVLFQCSNCGHTTGVETLAETTDEQCVICDGRTLRKIPFTSGYDEPHLLNIWVRADSLEFTSGEQNVKDTIAKTFKLDRYLATSDEAEYLRDIAALIETRLAELDVEASIPL
jgi:DNA-directed RNA polymerase subunit RPC12/RpoP